MRAVPTLLVLVTLLAGCTDGAGPAPTPTTATPTATPDDPRYPDIPFGGQVVDALDTRPVPEAEVKLNLAFLRPCRQESIGYTTWQPALDVEGRWNVTTPRPRSNDVAFFLHVAAPGYAESVTFLGPTEIGRGVTNLTTVLHPKANVTGIAPPGTLVALAQDAWPRFAVADANASFAFEDAHVHPRAWVAATELPARGMVAAPGEIRVASPNATGWTLQGTVTLDGARRAADLVAWNGTQMWSVARAGSDGAFTMPLPPEPATLRLEARTPDGTQGGVLPLDLNGPPATRVSMLLRALC